jgi:3-hydroxyisobutyrate dehydrogenase
LGIAWMNVAFLGLGAIGTPMAAHVAARHALAVWNRTGATAHACAKSTGATVARTPREAATGAEIVVTCLSTSADLEGLLDGPDGLLAGLGQGALLLDCTSGDPAASRRIAERLAAKGIAFVDAPVSGGVNGAEAATLTVMAGGAAEALDRGRPVLESFARRIELMGPVGTGHAMKAVNNALLAVNIFAVGEGLAALVAAGIPAARAVAVLNAASGRSFVSETLVPERVLTGTFPLTFRLALLDKDTGIALDVAASAGVEAPVLELSKDLLAAARAALGEEADYLEPIRLIESASGVEIRG